MENIVNLSGRAMQLRQKCKPLYNMFLRGEISLIIAEKMIENQERSKENGR